MVQYIAVSRRSELPGVKIASPNNRSAMTFGIADYRGRTKEPTDLLHNEHKNHYYLESLWDSLNKHYYNLSQLLH